MGLRRALLIATGLISGAVALPVAAFAQSSSAPKDDTALSEVVVTANRRSESLQDVGTAVTALDAQALQARGVNDPRDISKVAPGVVFDAVTSGNSSAMLTVRGVSQTDYSAHQESPNSVYFDEIYLPTTAEYAYPLYDVGALEVLRGPQGTLRGRASSGGLMSITPALPTDYFTGYAELAAGSYNERAAEGAVSGPISDKVRFRLSSRLQYNDGWWKNHAPGGKNANQRKFWGVRGQVESDLTENLTARLSVVYNKTPTASDTTFYEVPVYLDAANNPQFVGNKDAYGFGPGTDAIGIANIYRPREGAFPSISHYKSDLALSSLYLTYKLGEVTISSITSGQRFKGDYRDVDGSPIIATTYTSVSDLKQYTQELRASAKNGPLQWTVGGFAMWNDTKATQGFNLPFLSGTEFAYNLDNPVRQKTTSIAVFSQLEYAFTDQLKLIVGGRLTHEKKTFASRLNLFEWGEAYGTPASMNFSKATAGDLAEHKANLFSGKIELDYKPSDQALFYASVSRGIKTAGFNANLGASNTAATTPFRSEYLYAYEVGSKLELFDRHVRLNTAAFYNDYHRFQGYAFVGAIGTVRNYDGRMYGVESELTVILPAGFEAGLAGSYINSKLYDVPTAYGDQAPRDMQFAMAPHWTYNASLAKSFYIGDDKLKIEWTGSYLGERYVSIDNNLASYLPSKFEHNLRIAYDIRGQDIQLAAWVNNIDNSARPIAAGDYVRTTGDIQYSYGRPRWYGVSIRKSF